MTNGTTHKRILELDGLRACAIIAVFLSHAFRIRMLWIGVDMFFVLSGFLITGILVDLKHKDLKGYFLHFYQRRVRRILPPYLLVLVVVSIFFGLSWTKLWYMYFGLTNYIMQIPGPEFMPFNPLWSLGVEEQFYLLWPLAVYFVSDRKLPYVAIALMVIAPILRVLAIPYDADHQLVYMGTPFRMDDLAMGALLTFVWRSHGEKVRRYGYLGLILVALTPVVMLQLKRIGGFSTVDNTVRANIFTYEIALYCATGAFLWALGGRFTGILRSAPFQFLGRISYSFYLVHLSTMLLMERYFQSRVVIALLGLAISTTYAALSWYLMEQPILRGGNRRTRGLELAAAEAGTPAHKV